ncbi:MAG TPA: 16S rRNA (cytidine(1402)-2'-O)-methyltransferase [Solirubrobacteraceae bacterium]|jgi:16S rRNA (cytidine1402-2'-O)-methyltransferase|nr:16S rRNA (cytidine(1402)-2'-O)-methyltransferase [Solirubrobacteraceae bacterium]
MTPAGAAVGRLLVCPTPIGNLEDVTLRVLDALRDADAVACEDTRHTRVLLDRHGIRTPLLSVREQNERTRSAELVRRVAAGEVIALVSDAGTPLVSDPGFAVVRACLAEGLPVDVLPGPSAVVTAVVASGLPVERWTFVGFLPRRRRELEDMLFESAETLVAFESPRRLASTLALLAEREPARAAAVCRELTKLHEEVRRGPVSELAEHYRENPARGEVVLVLGAAEGGSREISQALSALRELVAAGAKARPAAAAVGSLTGLAANELYRELMRSEQ